jgi:hypothetical protein
MQEMDISKTKDLSSLRIIPTAKTVKVKSLSETISDVSQQSTHESEVVCIDRDESGDIVLVLLI